MLRLLAALLALAIPVPALAQGDVEVPYWASLTADKVNMRVGPARDYKIASVYKRKHLPMNVVRLQQGRTLVEEPESRTEAEAV